MNKIEFKAFHKRINIQYCLQCVYICTIDILSLYVFVYCWQNTGQTNQCWGFDYLRSEVIFTLPGANYTKSKFSKRVSLDRTNMQERN